MISPRLLSFIILLAACSVPVLSIAQIPADKAQITIVIEPVFKGKPLKLASKYYVNGHGDTLYIDLLKFYITNIKLNTRGGYLKSPFSHLVDAEDTASLRFRTEVIAGSFPSLEFVIGVDSERNTNGANGGDLDPAKGMYWAWNSGYIMAKLEGHARVCKTLHHAFEFHIGGYMPPYNAARVVSIIRAAPIITVNGKNTTIRIRADVAAWFNGINLAKTNHVVIPGKEAAMIADNYAKMFSLIDIKSE